MATVRSTEGTNRHSIVCGQVDDVAVVLADVTSIATSPIRRNPGITSQLPPFALTCSVRCPREGCEVRAGPPTASTGRQYQDAKGGRSVTRIHTRQPTLMILHPSAAAE